MIRILTVACALFAIGCSKEHRQPPPQTVLITESVAFECGEPPAVEAYKARPVQWTVQTLANGNRVFTLTGAMYEALMTNLVNSAASAAQLAAQRDFYARCIERSRTPLPVLQSEEGDEQQTP